MTDVAGMIPESFLEGRVSLWAGDCLDVLARIDECSIDSCVTDPPYHLTSIVKRFGSNTAAPAKVGKTGAYARASSGFMGKTWDGGDVAFQPETWAAVWRALKPGAHLVAFSGTRTYHRMACAIEDAGFEIRDQIGWAYGSGFPKSHNAGNGWGTALKPAWEPIVLARKPLIGTVADNVLKHGTGAINIDACRVETDAPRPGRSTERSASGLTGEGGAVTYGKYAVRGSVAIADTTQGRWPANVIHDGSEEVVGAFPDAPGQQGALTGHEPSPAFSGEAIYGAMARTNAHTPRGDSGSAARFFYTAKADADDRLGSKHPTVKPVDLMQYLVRLVTPHGGIVLDPFAGTGTTGEAAWREGFNSILIEREAEYQNDIRRRMQYALAGPDARAHAIVKAKGLVETPGPLFDTYDPQADLAGSLDDAYGEIRARQAAGGEGWQPK